MALQDIALHGGPGDGQTYRFVTTDDVLRWKPTDERDKVAARMYGHHDCEQNPVLYVRSRRTRTIFVYQP